MGISSWVWCGVLLYLALFLTPFPLSVLAYPYDYPTANSSTSWTNSLSAPNSKKFEDGSFVRIILAENTWYALLGSGCACGFFCNQTCNSYLFAIFSVYYKDGNNGTKIVRSANPKNPISINATLQLISERGLFLLDANGTIAWSTDINGKSVAGLYLTDTCNLKPLGKNYATIWQSFDHPTGTLVAGQKLMQQQLLTSEGGLFSISLTNEGFFAYINSNPPQPYFSYRLYNLNFSYVQF